MEQVNTLPFPDAERIRVLNEYQDFLQQVQDWLEKCWKNTVDLNPIDTGYLAALRLIQALQKGDQRLRHIFDVPMHLYHALRRMLMIRQIGESDDAS